MSGLKRYAISLALGVLSLVLFIVGTLGFTVWRPAQEIVATGTSAFPFVMTRSGVLPLYADSVTVTATSSDPTAKIWLAQGTGPDITAWLSGHSFDEIVGLKSLQELKFVDQTVATTDNSQSGTAATGTSPDDNSAQQAQSGLSEKSPIASDMWTALNNGTGSLTMTFGGTDLDSSLLIATDGTDPAPTITLTWKTPQLPLIGLAGLILGGLVLLLTAIVGAVTFRSLRRRNIRAQELQTVDGADETVTGEMTIIPPAVLLKLSENSQAEKKPAPDEDPVPAEESKALAEPPVETVTSESGMLNLSALQGGGAFPTRKALKEARDSGASNLIIEGHEFKVGDSPSTTKAETSLSIDTSEAFKVLGKRSTRHAKWK